MGIKTFFSKLLRKGPSLNDLVHRFSKVSSAVYSASKRVAPHLQKLGQRGVALLPQVIQAIEFAQSHLPVSGSGKERLELVRQILNGIYVASEIPNLNFGEDWREWVPVIESQVAELKDRGILTSVRGK